MITLRPYQEALINNMRDMMRTHRSILAVSPTGSGKTVMFSYMASRAVERGLRVEIMAHREELIDQIAGTLAKFGIDCGFVCANRPMDQTKMVQVASVQTLVRRLDRVQVPDLLIVDECHHCIGASQYGKIIAVRPNSKIVGVTATPQRLSGEGLGELFSAMVVGPTVAELMQLGSLCRYRIFAPPGVDCSQIKKRAGDYAQDQAAALFDKPSVTGDAVAHYKKHSDGKRAVAFCISIEHADHVAAQFRSNGYRAERLDGNLDGADRKAIVQRFSTGQTQILTNCAIVSEGFDLPAIETAILLRPTQSLSLHLQQVGRALRPYPGKDKAIILDHAGNVMRHGLPDEDRQWSLNGSKRQKSDEPTGPGVTICKNCFAAIPSGLALCPECAAVITKKEREINHIDGELAELDLKKLAEERKKKLSEAKTLEDLIAYGKAMGYKNPHQWAGHIWTARRLRNQGHAKRF